MKYELRIRELGIELPAAPSPLGSYVAAVRTGNLVFLSGMLPLKDGALMRTGKFGAEIDAAQGPELARQCALNALAVLRSHLGSLDRVVRCVKLSGFVASAVDFTAQPGVINGASDFMFEVFGEAGRHARAAVGVGVLPLDAPVEIEFVFEVDSADDGGCLLL